MTLPGGTTYTADELIGEGGIFDGVILEFKVVSTYKEVNGKFSQVLGNVAVVDCKYVHNNLFEAGHQVVAKLLQEGKII